MHKIMRPLIRYCYCLAVVFSLLLSTASSFSPSQTVPFSSRTTIARLPSSSQSSSPLLLANQVNNDDDDDNEQPTPPKDADTKDANDDAVTALERARVLSYRATIGASALLLSIQAVGDVGVLEGTGLDLNNLLAEQSTSTLPLASGITLLLCPVPSNRIVEFGALSLGIITMGLGLYSGSMIGVGDTGTGTGGIIEESLSWTFAMVSLMAISVREIWYFGAAYKTECGITLVTLPWMLDLNDRVPFTIPACALGMSVLAAGKVFEPCREDLIRSNSEFMAK